MTERQSRSTSWCWTRESKPLDQCSERRLPSVRGESRELGNSSSSSEIQSPLRRQRVRGAIQLWSC